jgi:hypothetical protein
VKIQQRHDRLVLNIDLAVAAEISIETSPTWWFDSSWQMI